MPCFQTACCAVPLKSCPCLLMCVLLHRDTESVLPRNKVGVMKLLCVIKFGTQLSEGSAHLLEVHKLEICDTDLASVGLRSDASDVVPTLQACGDILLTSKLLLAQGWKLVVTGHSLGAGVAALLSLRLRSSFPGTAAWFPLRRNASCWA